MLYFPGKFLHILKNLNKFLWDPKIVIFKNSHKLLFWNARSLTFCLFLYDVYKSNALKQLLLITQNNCQAAVLSP